MQNLQIDGQRLWDSLMHTAQIGGTAKGGICRLTLTDLDARCATGSRRNAKRSAAR